MDFSTLEEYVCNVQLEQHGTETTVTIQQQLTGAWVSQTPSLSMEAAHASRHSLSWMAVVNQDDISSKFIHLLFQIFIFNFFNFENISKKS
jgi:hypothetical protein